MKWKAVFRRHSKKKQTYAIWQLAKSTLKKSTFQFATAIKTNENIWEHCSCTVYKNLSHIKKIRPHRSRQRKDIFNVTASKQQTNGRQQLIKALLHARPNTKRVLLNIATANKTNQKKWKHCSCTVYKIRGLKFTNPQRVSEKQFFDNTVN